MSTERFDMVLARADRVMAQVDQRKGPVRSAALRERDRMFGRFGRALTRATLLVLAVSIATIVIGLFVPIGMIGFLAAVSLAMALAVVTLIGGIDRIKAPSISTELPNDEMVQQFDSYIYRTRKALPAPAQAQIDQLSAALPPLRETLARVDQMDPNAQDARRLMSTHLPGLIDRYLHVPAAYRGDADGEGVSVDQRLIDALAAGRQALGDISEKLARADLAAFETQGRFIQSRYKEEKLD
ncbi:hypothetical protein SH584_12065 [Sphingomonas sp. LY29]|uniref:hypothetical protein n=1 Tax=unclassified Sphingomonas TaxID=196159 RepID=UPI002ADEA753|nr:MULTISPECIES: hypothetical protein [unclassified Sphingomonas]MEA1071558.1 hypothetical protein [Sphingomonas sp. LY160]WRP25765.1 hypothetical protein SH584_12065 [Sphingomonas sp. LY29]